MHSEAFSLAVFLVWMFLILLLLHRFSVEFTSGELADQLSTVITWVSKPYGCHLGTVGPLKSCWKRKSASPWSLWADGSIKCSKIWSVAVLTGLFCHQPQSTLCEALPSSCFDFCWQSSQNCSRPCCLCTFPTPFFAYSQISINVLRHFPSLSRVLMIIIWTNCQVISLMIVIAGTELDEEIDLYRLKCNLLKLKIKSPNDAL